MIPEHLIIKHIEKLPENIKKVIFSLPWEDRTREIAKKYSLTPEQTESLVDVVTCTLVGLEKEAEMANHITNDLGISKLLTGQILLDLDKRVFDLVLSALDQNTKTTLAQEPTQTEPNIPPIPPKPTPPTPVSPPATQMTSAPVQKPVNVPRFNLNQEASAQPNIQTPKIPPQVETPRYTSDPYREPII